MYGGGIGVVLLGDLEVVTALDVDLDVELSVDVELDFRLDIELELDVEFKRLLAKNC